MKTIIEVGANSGTDTINLAADGSTVYAFEPTHELIKNNLRPLSKQYPNIKVIPFAVDTTNNFTTFNIAGQSDWGCSSLHKFNTDIHQLWPGRKDFKFTKSVNTFCIRLDSFLEMSNIKEVDYLWIDAQGNDWNVLKSLGKQLDIVKEGKCEVSYTVSLYNTDNTIENVKPWLEKRGFIVKVNPDKKNKECDLHFKKCI
jgi:FkbM family methyltransferase